MKHVIAILLVFLYSLSATGATFYMHLCNGETHAIGFDKAIVSHLECPLCQERKLSCHADENKSCKDVQVRVDKLDQNYNLKDTQHSLNECGPAIVVLHWIPTAFNIWASAKQHNRAQLYQQIPYTEPPGFLLNCNFRI